MLFDTGTHVELFICCWKNLMWLQFVSLDNLSLSSGACEWLQTLGDLGLVAKASRTSQKVMYKPPTLTCVKVLETFREIAKVYQTSPQSSWWFRSCFFLWLPYLQLHLAVIFLLECCHCASDWWRVWDWNLIAFFFLVIKVIHKVILYSKGIRAL